MKKKIFGVFLVVCMLISLVVMPVSAHTGSYDNGTLYYDISNNQVTITDCVESASGSLTIPSTLGGYPVTSIGWHAFECCSCLTSITIPDSVTSIGGGAFYDCYSLTSITIPDSVTSIGGGAFYYCSSLVSITIPDSVTNIGDEFFLCCSSLTNITIPSGVTSIGGGAFAYCSRLTSITIPDSVTSIGNGAFCDTAWYNNQPNGLVYAGKVAYEYKGTMPANTSITLKDGTLGIGDSAFSSCSSLTSITIPDSVTSIESYAFDNTAWFNNQPDGVVYVGKVAYKYKGTMPENTSIGLKDGTLGIAGSAFYECSSLTSITVPDSVTNIGDGAFSGCSSLTSVMIPNSVTYIGYYAFSGCSSLTSITIGSGVTYICCNAFAYCSSLTTVNYLGGATDWNNIRIETDNDYLRNANRVYNYKYFTNTVDGGYYTESDSDPMSEITGGILAFGSKYNQFNDNKANITKYGFLVYNQANENKKATVEASSVENLTATNGKFSTYLQVPKANLTTRVVAKPFVIVSGTTIWGDIMETSVAELDKWLGKKAN